MENQANKQTVTHSDGSVASDACDGSDACTNINENKNQNENTSSSVGRYSFEYVFGSLGMDSDDVLTLRIADAAGLMLKLRRDYRLTLFVGEDGIVHGRLPKGVKLPDESKPLIAHLKEINDTIASILRTEDIRDGITVEDALSAGALMREGRLVLTAPVVYHRKTNLCDLKYLAAKSVPA